MGSLCRVDGKTSCRKIPGQPALPTPDRVFPDGTPLALDCSNPSPTANLGPSSGGKFP